MFVFSYSFHKISTNRSAPQSWAHRRGWELLLALVLLVFIFSTLRQIELNTSSDALDQGAYLIMGIRLKEAARLVDPYRQPLFAWLISPFASRDLSYFTWSKLISLLCGAVTIAISYGLAKRLLQSRPAALAAAALLAGNSFFVRNSATVATESLLALLLLLIWYWGLRALGTQDIRRWFVGGILTGLGYLAKESALLWLPAWLVGTAIAARFHFRRYAMWLVFMAGLVAMLSPILVYNTLVFGFPFHSGNLADVIWMDNWEQFFAARSDPRFSLIGYFQTHSLATAATRLIDGLGRVATMFVSVALPFGLHRHLFGTWDVSPVVVGILFFSFVLLGGLYWRTSCRSQPSAKAKVAYTVSFLIAYWIGTAWLAPVTFDTRYMVPLLPTVYTAGLGLVSFAGRRFLTERMTVLYRSEIGFCFLCGVGVVTWTLITLTTLPHMDPFASDRRASATEVSFVQRVERIAQGTGLVSQPSHDLPTWLIEDRVRIVAMPPDTDWVTFSKYASTENASYLLLTPELYLRRLGLFKPFFTPEWPSEIKASGRNRLLSIRVLPASWELVDASGGLPSPYQLVRMSWRDEETVNGGDAALATGDWSRAEKAYLIALEQGTGDKASLERTLGQIAALGGRPSEALAWFNRAIAEAPDRAWYYTLRADQLACQGHFELAEADYHEALRRGAGAWANVHASLGWIAAQRREMEQATRELQEAYRLAPENPWYRVALARVLTEAGLASEAVGYYQRGPTHIGNWAFLNAWQAEAYQLAGEVPQDDLKGLPAGGGQTVGLSFETGLHFTHYAIDASEFAEHGSIRIALRWAQEGCRPATYRVYAKLINATYGIWGESQTDLNLIGVPIGPWQAGLQFENRFDLPVWPGTPPGEYQIVLAVQHLDDGRWLEPESGTEMKLGPVRLGMRPWTITQLQMTAHCSAELGSQVRLLGYRLDGEPKPGNDLDLTLFWQALEPIPYRYTVFTHLIDRSGKLVAQKDNEPADGFYPTSQWSQGQIIRDHYRLPLPSDARGEYLLQVGMYRAETGERLLVTRGQALLADAVQLAAVRIP